MPDKITLATITLSLNNLPIYVAQDKGFFTKENLFVEAVVLNARTRAIPALIGGSTQISASSAMTTIQSSKRASSASNLPQRMTLFPPNNAIPKDGEINSKGMDKVLQLLVEDGTMHAPLPKLEKYLDMSYLDEARRTAQ